MARISIFLNQSPFTFSSHLQAMDYIREASREHQILRVFFYQDAVLAGLNNQQPIQGQPSIVELWQTLAKEVGFPLQACIANSLRRGLFDETEAARYNSTANLADSFALTGLGEMAEAVAESDQLIQFGEHTQTTHAQTTSISGVSNASDITIDLLIHIKTPPTLDLEPLELGMACAAFEQKVAFVFSGDGKRWLQKDLPALRPGGKSASKLISALAMYDCDQVYYLAEDNNDATELSTAAPISSDAYLSLQQNSKHQLLF
ncbi:sulfurtransferase complex subunit TusD [Bacterioplanoides sp.]|uniref:sulfurtransferase complex subunit TusD n=1 Tax=Bacterioplanoides sp. TaxID=2066072 RepID=UPI003B00D2BA